MTNNRRGAALLTSLAILVVVGGLAALMFTRTLAEIRHSGDDSGIVQSLMLARGAANMAGAVMQGPVQVSLNSIVSNQANMINRWVFGNGAGVRPEASSVVQVLSTNGNSVANQLQGQINSIICGMAVPGLGAGESISLRIHVTNGQACGQDLPAGVTVPTGRFVEGEPRDGAGGADAMQTYGLPFVVVAEGRAGGYERRIVSSGEYHFWIGRGSFAQYALFTNVHRTATNGGQAIWFTDNTLFDGPVHTNQHFRYFLDPWFGGRVTSAGCVTPVAGSCQSEIYNQGGVFYDNSAEGLFLSTATMASMGGTESPVLSNGFGNHAPQFNGGVSWNSPYIPLPANNQDQRLAAETGGIYFGNNLYMMTLRATGPAPAMANMPADGSGTSAYQEVRGCTQVTVSGNVRLRCQEYRIDASGNMEHRQATYNSNSEPGGSTINTGGNTTSWSSVSGGFNGAIFVNGQVDRLTGPPRPSATPDNPASAPPALASFGQMTVASNGQIRITGDLKYQNPPCTGSPVRDPVTRVVTRATCPDLDADNILGIYSQNGDIRIGHNNSASGSNNVNLGRNAPRDVTVHGVLMSSTGVVAVDNWNSGGARGTMNLLGGIIENAYGAFGTFNASTAQMTNGYARAFTFDQRTGMGMAPPFFPTVTNDTVIDVAVFSFGQREQVE